MENGGLRMALRVDTLGNVKRLLQVSGLMVLSLCVAEAGSSKEIVPPPCPSWYADKEWNVSLWASYAFPNNDYPTLQNSLLEGAVAPIGPGGARFDHDRYLDADHAWGGGVDVKYSLNVTSGLDCKASP